MLSWLGIHRAIRVMLCSTVTSQSLRTRRNSEWERLQPLLMILTQAWLSHRRRQRWPARLPLQWEMAISAAASSFSVM